MKFKINLANVFAVFVIVIPLVVWNGYYEGPKVFLFLILGFFLTFFWLYISLVKKQTIILNKVDVFYLLWLLTLTVSSIFGVHPQESILGGSYRHQGVIFFFTLWLVYKTNEILKEDDKRLLFKGLAGVVLLEAVVVFIQYLTGKLYFGKPLGTIGEANAVAGFLAIGWVFVLENFKKVFLIVPAAGIILSGSRAGLIAGLINLALVFTSLNTKFKKIISVGIIFLTCLMLIVLSAGKMESPFEDRQTIWRLGLGEFSQRPMLGFGAESGQFVYDAAFTKIDISLDSLVIDRAHNLFLDVGLWSGVVGLIFFGLYLMERFKSLKTIGRRLAFIAFLVYAMFQPLSIVHWLFFFVL